MAMFCVHDLKTGKNKKHYSGKTSFSHQLSSHKHETENNLDQT